MEQRDILQVVIQMLMEYARTTHDGTASCSCPACMGMVSLERPRFFAGQLLTETELNSEQAYVLAKNRLHNRYLHGTGVVCGLEVVCHDCDGWVTIKPGYAIDPCGNDILVNQEHDFDVIKRIHECRDASRRPRQCDPVRPVVDEQCRDIEETWCITLAYDEKETRPLTALRRDTVKSCGCDSSKQCNCNSSTNYAQNTTYTRTSTQMRSGLGQTVAACEPTRIFESYRLDVCEAPADQCGDLKSALMDGTLFGRIIKCYVTVSDFLTKRVSSKSRTILFSTLAPATTGDVAGGVTTSDQYEALCRLYQGIRDLYLQNPLNVRCALINTLDQINCPPPSSDDTPATYGTAIRTPAYNLVALLVQYLLDCVCQNLLPSCPPDPQDDRLILACVTIKNDKILRICNFSCRQYAGAFPTVYYWLSLVPVIPLITQAVTNLCCRPDLARAQSPLVNDLLTMLDRLDPTGRTREALVADDFALPKMYLGRLNQAIGSISLGNMVNISQPESLNMATLMNKPIDEVAAAGNQAGVAVLQREVNSANEVPALSTLTSAPLVAKGDRVIVYTVKGKVVGYGNYDARQELADKQAELDAIHKELASLRKEVNTLKKRKG